MEVVMQIIHYFDAKNKEFWKKEISKSDWGAGQYLYQLLDKNQVLEKFGDSTKVLMLVEGETFISFCTLAEQDEIRDASLTPWIGFVYTFPEFRGNRYIGILLEYARKLAVKEGAKRIYISTDHIGVYEKYGYSFYEMMKNDENEDTRVYKIDI